MRGMEKNSCTPCTNAGITKKITEYKLVLVDMDGTLYYQRPLQLTMGCKMVMNALFCKNGLSELLTVLRFRKMREEITEQQDVDGQLYESLSAARNLSKERVQEIIRKWIYELPLTHIPRFRDAKLCQVIQQLEEQGIMTVIWSDYPTGEKQKALGLAKLPGCYNGREEIAALKPSPKGICYLMSQYGIADAGQVLVIGDRKSKDGAAAVAAQTDYVILKKNPLQRKKQYKKLL